MTRTSNRPLGKLLAHHLAWIRDTEEGKLFEVYEIALIRVVISHARGAQPSEADERAAEDARVAFLDKIGA